MRYTVRIGGYDNTNRTTYPPATVMMAMSTYDSPADKADEPPSKEQMVYCGSREVGESSKDVEDNVDGTLSIKDGHRAATGAKPGDTIWVRVDANGKETKARRQLHSTGRTFTLPVNNRKELDLEPGDEVEYWIAAAENLARSPSDSTQRVKSRNTDETSTEERCVIIEDEGGLTYHVVSDEDEDTTVCGADLSSRSVRRFSDPGDALELCPECNVRGSEEMSNREIVEWLAETIDDFGEPLDSNPSYLSKGHLVALRDHILELRDKQNA